MGDIYYLCYKKWFRRVRVGLKKFLVTTLLFLLTFSLFLGSVQANEVEIPVEEEVIYEYEIEPEYDPITEYVDPEFDDRLPVVTPGTGIGYQPDSIIRTAKYHKENVKKYNQWSGYRRVSDNMNTYGAEATGRITSDRETTFNTTASGAYGNLGFSFGVSESNKVGYAMNVPKNKRVYLGYKAMYSVETGTRVTTVGGTVRNRQTYTYKKPIYGEYKLLNAY
jgi:hypothetical protein